MRKMLAPPLIALLVGTLGAAHAGGAAPASPPAGGGMRASVEQALLRLPAVRRAAAAPERLHLERIPIAGGVVHYRFDLPVGPGEHDVVRLHRVVRERAPWFPAAAPRGLFLVHGDGWSFEPAYLGSPATPSDPHGVAVFLAAQGIDVWGIDSRWALVSADTSDLSFMADWGLATSVDDVDLSLTVARLVRALTGSGAGRMHLLGWSRGGQIGWALLGAETQRPSAFRNVRGFIAMDHTFKTDDEAIRQSNCTSYASIQELLDAGEVANDFRFVVDIGELALTAPEDPSPFFPALSNADLAEWIGASAGGGSIPHFHLVGGVVDPDTLATELLYTPSSRWFRFVAGSAAFQPLRINLDGAAIVCDEIDSPFDDHFADVAVPVLYVGAAGAFGGTGVYGTTLVSSTDVTTLIVSDTADPEDDWGHEDLFLADDAETRVWQPILDWIESH